MPKIARDLMQAVPPSDNPGADHLFVEIRGIHLRLGAIEEAQGRQDSRLQNIEQGIGELVGWGHALRWIRRRGFPVLLTLLVPLIGALIGLLVR